MEKSDILNQSAIRYITSLSKRHYEEIGFIPDTKIELYAQRKQIYMAHENDEPCGFLVFGRNWPNIKIYQACIQYDAQRRKHGFGLVAKLIKLADKYDFETISLWCAHDLEANEFWRECGFKLTQVKLGGARRGRKLNRWVYLMPNSKQLYFPFILNVINRKRQLVSRLWDGTDKEPLKS